MQMQIRLNQHMSEAKTTPRRGIELQLGARRERDHYENERAPRVCSRQRLKVSRFSRGKA
jgi:hypothetical protein